MGRHYVPVTGGDNGEFFAMLDVTDPSRITAGRGGLPKFDVLAGPTDVKTIEIKGIPYALVTASDDDGLQIINMSDPSSPIPVAGVTDGDRFILDGAYKIAAAEIGDRYYALVTAGGHFQEIGGNLQIIGGGLQIIDITNPANPSPTASVTQHHGRIWRDGRFRLHRRGRDRRAPLRAGGRQE